MPQNTNLSIFHFPITSPIRGSRDGVDSDHIGSSSFITDANGIASQHLQYLPFGETFVEQSTSAPYNTPYKFSAKEKDEETGYSYFGARYLNSDISIWLSVDPMSDKGPSFSPYVYCFNNPIMLSDPDGKFPWEAKNIRDARKEARRTGGEFERWKGQDGNNWASVDYSKAKNYQGTASCDVKVYKPKGQSWAEKYKDFSNNYLEGGANGDPGTDQTTTKEGWTGAIGIIGTMVSLGTIVELSAAAAGVSEFILPIISTLNSTDDALTNSKGESGLQQAVSSKGAKSAIGNVKGVISIVGFTKGISRIKDTAKLPFGTISTALDAPSSILFVKQKIED